MRLLDSMALVLTACLVGCSGGGTISTPEDLQGVLASATAGERVCLPEGIFEGSFDVPAGVVLCGAGVGLTRLVGPPGQPTLRLTPGDATRPTTVTTLSVQSNGDYGIRAVGPGDVNLVDLEVIVPTAGAGIGVESLTALRLRNVDVRGPVTPVSAGLACAEADISVVPTHGVVAVLVESVEGSEVDISGFSHAGMLAVSSGLALTDSYMTANFKAGLVVFGGTADLRNVTIGAAREGAIFAGGADVNTSNLSVSGSETVGILQSQATVTHTDLLAEANAEGALLVQNSGGFAVTNGVVRNNGLTGIAALSSSGVSLVRAEITNTTLGDGIELLGSTTGVTLERVGLSDNARVGILFDLEGESFDGTGIQSIDIAGTGTQLGAIALNGDIVPGWDANIRRSDIVADNDSAFTGTLRAFGTPISWDACTEPPHGLP